MFVNTLEQLSQYTTIVADTGELSAIARLRPQDATTNPSLVTASFMNSREDILQELPLVSSSCSDIDTIIDELTVALGVRILSYIKGRISTEVNPKWSYDTQKTVANALELIESYTKKGIDTKRVLIKIAATWQGIQAARLLEKQGISCNLTLLFTDTQARACADAGVTLISPFVGRITDWQKQHENKTDIDIADDMGVNSVKAIYGFYKSHGYDTEIMGASFRSTKQILALAGCDLLTISPALLDELAMMEIPVVRQLSVLDEKTPKPLTLTQDEFTRIQDDHPLNLLLSKGIADFIKARETLADWLNV